MSMAKQGAKTAVPRLRFAEFVGKPFHEVQLKDVTSESVTRNVDGLSTKSVMGVAKAEGIVPMRERLIASDIARYKVVQKDCFAYNPMRLNIGSIARWQGDSDILVSPDYVVFQCTKGLDSEIAPAYLDHFRQSGAWEKFVTEGGDGSVRVRIYYKDLARLQLTLPSLAEQQKIADCLTSLYEVIAAQERKVEALKTHKRGLMQQLFPRKGETRPRLRFPEFRDAPRWKVDPVNKLISTVSPRRKIPTSGYRAEGRLPIVDQSPDSVCGWTDDLDASVDNPLPLIIFGDHTCVLKLVEHAFAQGADGIKIISNKPCIKIRFLYHALQVDPVSSTAYRRHFSLLQEKWVAFPEDFAEQQRIADCLSPLEAQIAAQSSQLAALKRHKQGLMQQLFPAQEVG
ncbi:restriction endonuclease subunit S [Xanthomonas campestris pv. pennamericanum]|uniref:restriction endonuclease subunit S n=1 Tax=Xanthomonas euvesicatoria TaxID=456327 RepID=UPI001C46E49F|nr:restriction endonuclease subunit S [Xanthomonas euvesicatoria]MBV6809692.1 restriction endonuclease subunit S [Xanthomonas campestris pv. pennamericanum]